MQNPEKLHRSEQDRPPPIHIGELAKKQCGCRSTKGGQRDQPGKKRHAVEFSDHARPGDVSGVNEEIANELGEKDRGHANGNLSLGEQIFLCDEVFSSVI